MKKFEVKELDNGITYGFVCVDPKGNVAHNNIIPENDAQLFADMYNTLAEIVKLTAGKQQNICDMANKHIRNIHKS